MHDVVTEKPQVIDHEDRGCSFVQVADHRYEIRDQLNDPCPTDQLDCSFDLGGGELVWEDIVGFGAIFKIPGTYQIRVEVTDDDGGSDYVEREVLVLPPREEEDGGCECGRSRGGSLLVLLLLTGTAWWRRATS